MTQTQHARGPWKVNHWDHQFVDANNAPVANCNMVHWGREVSEANARLIAAAPELLTALENLLEWADPNENLIGTYRQIDHAHHVIAKARGDAE